jgi:hypothetical protein
LHCTRRHLLETGYMASDAHQNEVIERSLKRKPATAWTMRVLSRL